MLPLLRAEVYEGPYHQQLDVQLPPKCKSKRDDVSLVCLFSTVVLVNDRKRLFATRETGLFLRPRISKI